MEYRHREHGDDVAKEERLLRIDRMLEKTAQLITEYYTKNGEYSHTVGIDTELQRAIAVLSAMDFYTEQSCFGHPDQRDDKSLPHQSRNVQPYITFTGYQEGDGLDEHGVAVGYTREQIDAACEKGPKDLARLQEYWSMYLAKKHEQNEYLVIDTLMKGAPCFFMQMRMSEKALQTLSIPEQDEEVQKAQQQLLEFMSFLEHAYVNGEIT